MQSSQIIVPYKGGSLAIAANYRPAGSDLIVCMHGLGCAKEDFDGIFNHPHFNSMSLLAFDWPGHGQSDRPHNFLYTMEEMGGIATTLINRIPHTRVFLVGHSMGAGIGLFTVQKIKNIAHFISIEGHLGTIEFSGKVIQRGEGEFLRVGFKKLIATLQQSSVAALRHYAAQFAQADPWVLYKVSESMVAWANSGKLFDMFNALPKKAYIYGDTDNAKDTFLHFKNVPTIHIPGASHFVIYDRPAEFYACVHTLLQNS